MDTYTTRWKNGKVVSYDSYPLLGKEEELSGTGGRKWPENNNKYRNQSYKTHLINHIKSVLKFPLPLLKLFSIQYSGARKFKQRARKLKQAENSGWMATP